MYTTKRALLLLLVLGTLGCSLFAQTVTFQTPPPGTTTTITPTPAPEWVPDPSAGHYDCPEGWTAYTKSEPEKYSGMINANPEIYVGPLMDKKGHVLGNRPPMAICIKDAGTPR